VSNGPPVGPDGVANKANVRFGVNRVTLNMRQTLPVFPHNRSLSESVGMSQRCQRTTSRAHRDCHQ
jgi:hypothetical protein